LREVVDGFEPCHRKFICGAKVLVVFGADSHFGTGLLWF
jgi:hypothetical protein